MTYQVLARKYRPATFPELAGQEHVLRALINALDNDRLHHAFLFTGTRGVGKTTIARILAKSLNCEEGISSQPCGVCSACREIAEGRFVDLIEVDAASRTRVDDTRELLDNVQYAPTRGRYKVYLIDEVHMLSSHSFNALLKTLEEPPPHVKFLLATTDPQKLPVTVLSRCLQFNLKRLPVSVIRDQLDRVLAQESVQADPPAVDLLARAADGSMRDGLSLLDQAIAFGGGALGESDVRAMLGTVERDDVFRLLEALADRDGAVVLETVEALDTRAPDYLSVLDELATALQRMAVLQMVPEAGEEWDGRERLVQLADRLSPEDVQLFYQIAILGRRDLPLAPEPRAGLEMCLLRMLAFQPGDMAAPPVASTSEPGDRPASRSAPAAKAQTVARSEPGRSLSDAMAEVTEGPSEKPGAVDSQNRADEQADEAPASNQGSEPLLTGGGQNWSALVDGLSLKGLSRQLADNCELEGWEGDTVLLRLDAVGEQLRTPTAIERLEKELGRFFGKTVKCRIRMGEQVSGTPAQKQQARKAQRQEEAEASIQRDPNVRALEEQFGARVEMRTVRYRSGDSAPENAPKQQ
ncbi:DNA polymerase-3 subunit gamma/tau [Natronospira proteinivora]|uniref:DNA polymerase III subunit gamma/tau n=1 Tax=Natronospira proteinivora TaxID=1807133 RepID=A0ABT1G845_9GAMM|nr:DNA polymerase III subunit gamma/tau [Natronospira proteinivora]MCP1726488.1 DNA polymerase-3 subunit gamma/tau [Natronospira proteinivora]